MFFMALFDFDSNPFQIGCRMMGSNLRRTAVGKAKYEVSLKGFGSVISTIRVFMLYSD